MLQLAALARPPRLAPVSLSVPAGTLVGVIGPNGAGKTTLLRAIAALSEGSGEARWTGRNIAAMPPAERARRIAWLPAERHIAWPLDVSDLVALGLPPSRSPDAIATALAVVDASAFARRRADTLSTGELARVLLARAMAGAPELLLLDEPVANLDPWHRLAIMEALAATASRGATVIAALHDLDLARRCDRLWLIDRGALVADAAPGEVLSPEWLARVFGVARDGDDWRRV